MLMKYLLLIPFGVFSTQFEIPEDNLFVSPSLGDVRLYHSRTGFHVHHEGTKYIVESRHVDPILRKCTNNQLRKVLEHYYIAVTKQNNKFYVMPRLSLSRL